MTCWVFIGPVDGLWTTGFYNPWKNFQVDRDYDNPTDAGERVHYLNGGLEA